MKVNFIDISKKYSALIIFFSPGKEILDSNVASGTPFRQDEIARSIQKSLTLVREAISKLDGQGLIKTFRFRESVKVDQSAGLFQARILGAKKITVGVIPYVTKLSKVSDLVV